MHQKSTRESTDDKLGAGATLVALLMSGLAFAGLVSASLITAQQLRATQVQATEAPPAGNLRGQNAASDSEWTPQIGPGGEAKTVLFTVREQGQKGDAKFWLDVAAQTRSKDADVEFVGLCTAGKTCFPPAEAEGLLTLISSMDPAQMRGLSLAARRERMLIYRNEKFQTMLPIQSGAQNTVIEIVRAFSQQPIVQQVGAGSR